MVSRLLEENGGPAGTGRKQRGGPRLRVGDHGSGLLRGDGLQVLALNWNAGETLVVTGHALVLVHEGEDSVPMRSAGKRIVPGDDALFAAAAGLVVRRQEGMVVGGEVSGKRRGEKNARGEPPETGRGPRPGAGRSLVPHREMGFDR